MSYKKYYEKKLFAIAMFFLVIGGISIGLNAFFKKDILRSVLGKNAFLLNILFLTIGISALSIGFQRDTYLPFLGPSVFPCSLLQPQVPKDANFELNITVRPGAKVLYWAAEPANKDLEHINNWKKAYLDYKNAGVAIADDKGKVTLKVRKPQTYTVPLMGELHPHIHFRECSKNGWMGSVRTIATDGKEYFENAVSAQESPEPITYAWKNPDIIVPKDAMRLMNEYAAKTANQSQMVQSGALDEFHSSWSSSFATAFP